MTTSARLDADELERCHRVAREEGLAPALARLGSLVVPGLLPAGPGGHALVPQEVAVSAERAWVDGCVVVRSLSNESTVDTIDVPGGPVVLLRGLGTRSGEVGPKMYGNTVPDPRLRAADPETSHGTSDQRAAWALGLVWLRLGLSEALRETCVRHLNGRRVGTTTLLQRQAVKTTVADGLIEHLEVRAVLTGVAAGGLPAVVLAHLHARITAADRRLVNLLGAGGYLAGGPGQVAHLSELLAEAHVAADGHDGGNGGGNGGMLGGATGTGGGIPREVDHQVDREAGRGREVDHEGCGGAGVGGGWGGRVGDGGWGGGQAEVGRGVEGGMGGWWRWGGEE